MTIAIIVFLAGIIAYPKLKPLLSREKGPGGPEGIPVASGGGQGRGNPAMGGGGAGRQALNVNGYLIQPVKMFDLVNSTGTLKPDEEVELSFETSGKIVAIYFSEGTQVKKGDLLAKMNDKPLQAQLEKLLAQKKLAEDKEFRQRSLLDKDAISRESYDQISTELQTITADINLIKARISETELRAPFDGTLGLRNISEGSYATPSTKIARLVKTSPIKIEFSVSEKYTGQIQPGFPIKFMVDGSNTVFNAKVYAVEPKIDIITKLIVIRAIYPNLHGELKPGRYTQVILQLSETDDAKAIPTEALIPQMEGEIVYVLRKGRAQVVKVGTGLRTESLVQVTEGLNFGDTLLASGILQLRQGLPVTLDTLITARN